MEISPQKEKPELSPAESEKFLLWESVILQEWHPGIV